MQRKQAAEIKKLKKNKALKNTRCIKRAKKKRVNIMAALVADTVKPENNVTIFSKCQRKTQASSIIQYIFKIGH